MYGYIPYAETEKMVNNTITYKNKKMKITLIFLLFLAVNSIAQQSTDSIKKLLVQKEQKLLDAIATGDKALWNAALNDSCIIGAEDGTITTKSKFIEDLSPLPEGYAGKIKVLEPTLRLYNNTAVLSYIADEYLELYNQKIHTQYRQVNTWVKRGKEWEAIMMQVFEIPKNPAPVSISENILKQYAGTYQLSSEKKCIVTVENGKLFVEKSGKKTELFAQTENVFFRNGDGRVDVLFIKDKTTGKYKMVERREGEDLVWAASL
jgi:hypothetical protein